MKTMAQMKVGSTGMFVGRTTTDCRFENKVGSEMLHIAYRKPEWHWETEVEAAEVSMAKGETLQVNDLTMHIEVEWDADEL
jgi:hypothetical protein